MSESSRRILVTRAAHQTGKLSAALRALGFEPVEVPVLEILPPESFASLDAALRQLAASPQIPGNQKTNVILSDRTLSVAKGKEAEGPAVAFPSADTQQDAGCPIHPQSHRGWVGDHESKPNALSHPTYDWLILTSANTVRALADRAAHLNLTLTNYTGQVAAVGPSTAAAAREAGLTVSLIPETYVAESLVESLANQAPNRVSGKRILIARAARARDVVPEALRAQGAEVEVVEAYRNAIPASASTQLRRALEQGIAAATFTSSSSVTHLAEVAKQAGIAFPFPGVKAISIGPITTQTLREHNWLPDTEANPFDIPGLAAAVSRALTG